MHNLLHMEPMPRSRPARTSGSFRSRLRALGGRARLVPAAMLFVGAAGLAAPSSAGVPAGNTGKAGQGVQSATGTMMMQVKGSPETGPAVASVVFSSDPNDDGREGNDHTYATGDDVEATVTFDFAVTVTGSPELELDFSSSPKTAKYTRGSGTTALVFSYTVAEDDAAPLGAAVGRNKLTLPTGAAIVAVTNSAAAAVLDHNPVPASTGHKVDGVRPRFVNGLVDGTAMTMHWSEPLSPDFLPAGGQLIVAYGTSITSPLSRSMSISANRMTGTLLHAVGAGQELTLSYVIPAGGGNEGEVFADLAGNEALKFLLRPILNQGREPARVTGLSVTPGVGELTVAWDAVSEASQYVVEWKSGDGDYHESRRRIVGGSVTNATIRELTGGTQYTVRVFARRKGAPEGEPSDGVPGTPLFAANEVAKVTQVALTSAPANTQNGFYKIGDAIEAAVTLDRWVTVDDTGGKPQLELDFDGTPKQAEYARGSGTARLVFSYTVSTGDADPDGIAIGANKLSANGGAIRTGTGTADATLAHDPVSAQSGHKVDGVRPARDPGVAPEVSVDGTKVIVTLTEAIGRVDRSKISITLNPGGAVVHPAASHITDEKVNLALPGTNRITDAGQTVSISWQAAALFDRAGNGSGSQEATPVDNRYIPAEWELTLSGGTAVDPDGNGTIKEGGADMTVTLRITNAVRFETDRTYDLFWGATALAPHGSRPISGRNGATAITIRANQASGSLVLEAPDEPFSLGYPVYALPETATLGARAGETPVAAVDLTWRDNETAPEITLSANPTEVTEGGSIRLTATPSVRFHRAANVALAVTGGSGVLRDAAPAAIPIGGQAASGSITVATDDDMQAENASEVVFALAPDPDFPHYTLGDPSSRTVTVKDNDAPAEDTGLPVLEVSGDRLDLRMGESGSYRVRLRPCEGDHLVEARHYGGNMGSVIAGGIPTEVTPHRFVLQCGGANTPGPWQTVTVRAKASSEYRNAQGLDSTLMQTPFDDLYAHTVYRDGTDNGTALIHRAAPVTVTLDGELDGLGAPASLGATRHSTRRDEVGLQWAGVSGAWRYDLQWRQHEGRYDSKPYAGGLAAGRATTGGNSWTISELDPDLPLVVRVRARSDRGVGPWRERRYGRTADIPGDTPMFTVADAEVRESGDGSDATMTFTVTLDPPAPGPQASWVDYETVDGTAKRPMDYRPTNGRLQFRAGESEHTVKVKIIDDTVDDDGETLLLRLTGAGEAEIADGEAVGTIRNAENAEPEAPRPLTASLRNVPQEHGGTGEFTFRVRFSEDPAVSYRVLRDEAFEVSGGTVTRARRVNGRDDLREIHVRVETTGDIGITLMGGKGCDERGGVCTSDGRRLSNSPSATVPGLATLSVADARGDEGPGASVEFTVRLGRAASRPVTVQYATSDGSATAGDDYVAARGTLTFAPGVTAQPIAVSINDDAHDEGEETFTLTLSDASGARLGEAIATGTIVNSDPMPGAWLARFGRAASDHVLRAIEARLYGAPQDRHISLGGRPLDRWLGQYRPVGDNAGEEWVLGPQSGGGASVRHGTGAAASAFGGHASATAAGPVLPALRDLLQGSSFSYTPSRHRDRTGWLGRWSAWGQGAATRFQGADGDLALDGEVATVSLGLDSQWERWQAGVVLAHSAGDGTYRQPRAGGGEITSRLTQFNPFARFAINRRINVWGALGYGVGGLTLTPEGADTTLKAGLTHTMAAFGGRGVFAVRSGAHGEFRLAVRSDAQLTRTGSESVASLSGVRGAARRVRLVLEGSGSLPWAAGVLQPTLEAGLRYDGGDAETGAGLEIASGLGYAAGRFVVQFNARTLLVHRDSEYREWGLSGSVRLQPAADGRGLNVSLGSLWGNAQSGVQAMWRQDGGMGLAMDATPIETAQRFTAQIGYGLAGPKGYGLWVPFLAAETAPAGEQALGVGMKLTTDDQLDVGLQLGLRQDAPGQSDYGFNLAMRWLW